MNSPSRFSLPSDSRLQPLYPFTLSEHPPELLRMQTPARKAESTVEKAHKTGDGRALLYGDVEGGDAKR